MIVKESNCYVQMHTSECAFFLQFHEVFAMVTFHRPHPEWPPVRWEVGGRWPGCSMTGHMVGHFIPTWAVPAADTPPRVIAPPSLGFTSRLFCLFKKSWWKWERVWACPAVFPVRVKHCHWGINSCVSSDGVPACQQAVVFARCKSVKRCCCCWWRSAPFLHSPSHSVSGLWRLLSTFFLKIDNVLLSHIFIHWIQGENNTLQGAKNMYITRRKEYITTTRRNQRYTLQGEKKTLIVFFSQVHF